MRIVKKKNRKKVTPKKKRVDISETEEMEIKKVSRKKVNDKEK